jgi:hypothetical protein
MRTVRVETCFPVENLCHSNFKLYEILATFSGLNVLSNLVPTGVLIGILVQIRTCAESVVFS